MSKVEIPTALLNLLSDVNAVEIKSHLYDDKGLESWLYSWRKAVEFELRNFSNNVIDDVVNALNNIVFVGGTKETFNCANETLYHIKKEVEKLRSDG